jgi:hypothetical protein
MAGPGRRCGGPGAPFCVLDEIGSNTASVLDATVTPPVITTAAGDGVW